MKIKYLVLLFVISTLFVGCQTCPRTVDMVKLDNGQTVKVTIDGNMDETTHQMFLQYIKMDAERHCATSTEPYKFKYSNTN